MRALLIDKPTFAQDVRLTECDVPAVKSGWVLVKIRAFGLNFSEKFLRHEEILADYIPKPIIPGIECVGEIFDASDSGFTVGQKVVAMMGGMGRSFNGSYAEFALLPTDHVFAVETSLDWAELAALPEIYFTAWGSLFECLHLKAGDNLLIRGATSAVGYAAIQLAKAVGAKVTATTHRENKFHLLEEVGADEIILDDGKLAGKISVTKALELVGAKVLRDTLRTVKPGAEAFVCNTGVLGGVVYLDKFSPIGEIPNGVYLTGFHSGNPTQKVIDEIFAFMNAHKLKPHLGQVFDFKNLREALAAQDGGKVNGKIVVRVD